MLDKLQHKLQVKIPFSGPWTMPNNTDIKHFSLTEQTSSGLPCPLEYDFSWRISLSEVGIDFLSTFSSQSTSTAATISLWYSDCLIARSKRLKERPHMVHNICSFSNAKQNYLSIRWASSAKSIWTDVSEPFMWLDLKNPR